MVEKISSINPNANISNISELSLSNSVESSLNSINFLPKQRLNSISHYTEKNQMKIWVNNYEIKFLKEILFNEFSVDFVPEIGNDNTILKEKVFKKVNLSEITKDSQSSRISLFTGGNLYLKVKKDTKLNEIYTFEVEFKSRVRDVMTITKYLVNVRNTKRLINLNSDYKILLQPIHKMLFELMINQVMKNNPSVETVRKIFVKKDKNSMIELVSGRTNTKIEFYPGFTTSINLTKENIFLTVGLRNRYLNTKNCWELMKELNNQEKIIEKFEGQSVKAVYSKQRNYKVARVNFEKHCLNTTLYYLKNRDDSSSEELINLVTYYKLAHNLTIQEPKQYLFEVDNKDGETIYLIPELCKLSGLDDVVVKDREFMQGLALHTKFEPTQRVKKTNEFFPLMFESNKRLKEKHPTSKETCEEYGISLGTQDRFVNAYAFNDPIIKSGNTKLDYAKLDRKPVHKNILNSNENKNKQILVVYNKKDYNTGATLENLFSKAGREYRLETPSFEWCEYDTFQTKDILKAVDNYGPENYLIVIFILDNKREHQYNDIKKHSLVKNGYNSQVVKRETIGNEKRGLSVASKLLIQINNKIGGCQYALDLSSPNCIYKNAEIMVVGVDSSHISGKRTGVAMVATTSKYLSQFYSHEDIIEEKNKTQLIYSVGKFVNKALMEYFKVNKSLPKGIVVYRQGVSEEQKEFLKLEISVLQSYCSGKLKDCTNDNFPIPFLFVLVNKKTNYKFFEKRNNLFNNPKSGMLVLDGVTDYSKFEFFIQPQQVTQGSATPTHYHVAYGNFNFFNEIPKLTYDLCSVYPNWPGPVRVPHVLKLAEKLAKMVSKTIKSELNEKLRTKPCYL